VEKCVTRYNRAAPQSLDKFKTETGIHLNSLSDSSLPLKPLSSVFGLLSIR